MLSYDWFWQIDWYFCICIWLWEHVVCCHYLQFIYIRKSNCWQPSLPLGGCHNDITWTLPLVVVVSVYISNGGSFWAMTFGNAANYRWLFPCQNLQHSYLMIMRSNDCLSWDRKILGSQGSKGLLCQDHEINNQFHDQEKIIHKNERNQHLCIPLPRLHNILMIN